MTERGGEEESTDGVAVRSDRGEDGMDELVFLAGVSMSTISCRERVATSVKAIGWSVVREKKYLNPDTQREEQGLSKGRPRSRPGRQDLRLSVSESLVSLDHGAGFREILPFCMVLLFLCRRFLRIYCSGNSC